MSRDRWIIVGVVVLAVLGFLVWKQADKDKKLGTTGPATMSSADFPTVSAPDDIDKITIKDGKKEEVVLVKKDDKWRLAKPVDAPGNQTVIKEVVTNLGTLKVKEQVPLTLDDDVKKSKKLDADQAVHVVVEKGGEKKLDALFGGPASGGTLALIDSKPGVVWAVTGFSS